MIDYFIVAYWFVLYCLLYFGFYNNRKTTIMLIALIHASLVTTLSGISLYISGTNFLRANLVLELVTSKISFWYFFNDLVLLLFFDLNAVYIIHHLCALFTIYYTINLGFGLSAVMLILFLGEITNPFRLAKQMVYEHNKLTYSILNFIFSWLFLIVRCIFMTYYYFLMLNNFIPHIEDLNTKYIILLSTSVGLLGGYIWSGLIIRNKLKRLKN